MPVLFKNRTGYKTMEGPIPDSRLAKTEGKLVDVSEPVLQRKKRAESRPATVFPVESAMEPPLQSKKRNAPQMAQTSPVKRADPIPQWQAKKRPGQGPPMKLQRETNLLQSKRRVAGPEGQKPLDGDELTIQKKTRVVPPFIAMSDKKEAPLSKAESCAEKVKSAEISQTVKNDTTTQSKKKVPMPGDDKPIKSEPPMQSKRRTPGPHTTMAPDYYDKNIVDEYALLGSQDKFAQNIKYKIKSRDMSPPKQPKLQRVATSKERYNPQQAPAPVVNTDQYKAPPTPMAPRKPKDQSDPLIARVKAQVDKEFRSSGRVQRSPRAAQPRSKSVDPGDRNRYTDANIDSGDYVKESLRNKKIHNMNEFVQTDMEKGIRDSAPEAPAEYALKYKAGVSAPRPSKKLSEYQKQFAWKDGARASPLLKAEQVVYNNNPQLSPPKKDPIKKMSEYQRQFKQFKMVPVADPEEQIIPEKALPKAQVQQMKRAKSMENLSPSQIRAAGSAPVIAYDNPRLTIESERPTAQQPSAVPVVPKGKTRNFRSEYLSNFKSPTQFNYSKGAWKGANPAHLAMSMPEGIKDSPKALSNWFAEVLELRRKADEYRQRAQGTHFSRQHQVQLMAEQADLWDASTAVPTARSGSAVSLDSARYNQRPASARRYEQDDAESEYASTEATIAPADDQISNRLHEMDELRPRSKMSAWEDEEEGPDTPSTYDDFDQDGGRLRTPDIRSEIERSGNMRNRHHLDLTTPSVGGALLSSPPRAEKRGRKKKPSPQKTVFVQPSQPQQAVEENGYDSDDAKMAYKPLAGQKTFNVGKGPISPQMTFGMPSRDSHVLRDDAASTPDRPLTTQFVHSPVQKRSKPRPAQDGLGAIDEGYGQTYNKTRAEVLDQRLTSFINNNGVPHDDDVLSLSARSVASSCSLASEVLERARRRKDDFWGKGGIATR